MIWGYPSFRKHPYVSFLEGKIFVNHVPLYPEVRVYRFPPPGWDLGWSKKNQVPWALQRKKNRGSVISGVKCFVFFRIFWMEMLFLFRIQIQTYTLIIHNHCSRKIQFHLSHPRLSHVIWSRDYWPMTWRVDPIISAIFLVCLFWRIATCM